MTSASPALPQISPSQRRFSADEYERMIAAGILAEDERVELLEGTIYPMSPIGSWHAACVKRLVLLLIERLALRDDYGSAKAYHVISETGDVDMS
jgi:Uma2 family endonuclease